MIKKLIFTIILQFSLGSAIYAQAYKNVELKGGLLFSQPSSLQGMNTSYETQAETGWQLGLTKNWPVFKALNLEIGSGYSQHHFNANPINPSGDPNERALSLSYVYFEPGLNLRPTLGPLTPYLGSSFRIGGLTNSNLEDHFSLFWGNHNKYDYGINLRAGIGFPTGAIEPFLEVNFYQGLSNVGDVNGVANYNLDGNIIKNELFHQFWGLQLGLKF